MKTGKRNIKSGNEFNRFFRAPEGKNVIIKRVAQLDDTIELMKEVISKTLLDTVEISKALKADTESETCRSIWEFCFIHLQYTKDDLGKEQVRRPSRTWQDRHKGIDCDCMSVFIGSILSNLSIPYSLRLTKYASSEFEHVYPVAHTTNGLIIMDTVVHKFNREVKYSAKKDIKMELQYLNGFDDEDQEIDEVNDLIYNEYPMDAQAMLMQDLDGLEGRAERKAKRAGRKAKRKEKFQNFKNLSLKEKLKKGLHVVNRLNPATGLLRLGILASMKLNVMKVASKIRFAYWSASEAQRNNMDLSKYNQLARIREKLEKIFYGAGGKTSNLKKAILSGKGNRDKRISLNGLGFIHTDIHDEDDLRTILGDDIYFDEAEGLESGINGLGSAAATGTAIASATGVLASIAALIKKLGSLFKKNSPQAQQELIQENTENQEEKTRKFSIKNLVSNVRSAASRLPSGPNAHNRAAPAVQSLVDQEDFMDASISKMDSDDGQDEKGIMAWIKKNPMMVGGIALALIGGGYLIYKNSKKKKTKSINGVSLSGTRKKTTKVGRSRKTARRLVKTKSPSNRKRKTSVKRKSPKTSKTRQVKVIELL